MIYYEFVKRMLKLVLHDDVIWGKRERERDSSPNGSVSQPFSSRWTLLIICRNTNDQNTVVTIIILSRNPVNKWRNLWVSAEPRLKNTALLCSIGQNLLNCEHNLVTCPLLWRHKSAGQIWCSINNFISQSIFSSVVLDTFLCLHSLRKQTNQICNKSSDWLQGKIF